MNILVFGAGAIGSFFGAMLSEQCKVVLIGRKKHCQIIKQQGLKIKGNTSFHGTLPCFCNAVDVSEKIDIVLLTVKAYDTQKAMEHISDVLTDDTIVVSLQNGLDNVETIAQYIPLHRIICGLTTHGVVFSKPGVIRHTGAGWTLLGALSSDAENAVETLTTMFNNAGINTVVSTNIRRDLWVKAIINSSINPLTAFFECKNGYLKENPVLKGIAQQVCFESTKIAQAHGVSVEVDDMWKQTEQVISDTAENQSSMLQSIFQGKKTEIDAINGHLVSIGKKNKVSVMLNEVLCDVIHTKM